MAQQRRPLSEDSNAWTGGERTAFFWALRIIEVLTKPGQAMCTLMSVLMSYTSMHS